MVVGHGLMPPSRLSAAETSSSSSSSDGVDDEGGVLRGDHPPPFMDLPRLLATARHGDLSTLPADQRHLLARMLLAGGMVMPNLLMQQQVLMRRRRLILYQRRLQQQRQQQQEQLQQQQQQQESAEGRQRVISGEFKEPEVPLARPRRSSRHENHHVPPYERFAREMTPPTQRRPRERTPPAVPLHRSSSQGHRCSARNNENAVGGQQCDSVRRTSSPPSSAASSLRCAPERTHTNRSSERSVSSKKRLRGPNSGDQLVPVTPRTHPNGPSAGLSYSSFSCSSSPASSVEAQWRPVKMAHLCDSFKSSVENRPPTCPSSSSSSSSSKHLPCASDSGSVRAVIPKSLRSSLSFPSSRNSSSIKHRGSGGLRSSVRKASGEFSSSEGEQLPDDALDTKESIPSEEEEEEDEEDEEDGNSRNLSPIPVDPAVVPESNCRNPCPIPGRIPVVVPENSCLTPATCPQGASSSSSSHKYHWINQLTRIFLQEVPDEDAQDKEAETAEGGGAPSASTATSTSLSSSSSCPSLPSAGTTECSSTDSGANHSSNKSSSSTLTSSSTSSTSGQGASVATTLAGTGMGNPFARAAPQTTWGQASESHDHKPILAPSRLGPQSDAGTTKVSSSGGGSVLRQPTLTAGRPSSSVKPPSSFFTAPPALTVTGSSPPQASRSAFRLKPSVLGTANPFSKISSNTENRADSASGPEDGAATGTTEETSPRNLDVSSSTSVTTTHTTAPSGDRDHSQSADSRTSSNSSNNITNSSSSRSMFVPLSRNGEGNDSSLNPNIRNSFIFGQNLKSKVTGAESSVTSSSDSGATANGEERQTGNLFSEAASGISRSPDSPAATNGRIGGTGNLFSEAASEILPTNEENAWNSGPSLAETSRELTEKENSQKRKFDQVEVITGEESESNVLQMNCKLYAWICGSWQERGRGILRLNDWDAGQEIHSRLVIRTQGTLTVMLNTKVWAEMSVERASSKSVRFTALDADGQPKIFLAMGSPKDVDLLYNSLEWRVAASRSQTHEEGDSDGVKKAKKEEAGATALTR